MTSCSKCTVILWEVCFLSGLSPAVLAKLGLVSVCLCVSICVYVWVFECIYMCFCERMYLCVFLCEHMYYVYVWAYLLCVCVCFFRAARPGLDLTKQSPFEMEIRELSPSFLPDRTNCMLAWWGRHLLAVFSLSHCLLCPKWWHKQRFCERPLAARFLWVPWKP